MRRWRCGFCGFARHGTRRGVMRCMVRTFKLARWLGVYDPTYHGARDDMIYRTR